MSGNSLGFDGGLDFLDFHCFRLIYGDFVMNLMLPGVRLRLLTVSTAIEPVVKCRNFENCATTRGVRMRDDELNLRAPPKFHTCEHEKVNR
jgi:hypothetical protein